MSPEIGRPYEHFSKLEEHAARSVNSVFSVQDEIDLAENDEFIKLSPNWTTLSTVKKLAMVAEYEDRLANEHAIEPAETESEIKIMDDSLGKYGDLKVRNELLSTLIGEHDETATIQELIDEVKITISELTNDPELYTGKPSDSVYYWVLLINFLQNYSTDKNLDSYYRTHRDFRRNI